MISKLGKGYKLLLNKIEDYQMKPISNALTISALRMSKGMSGIYNLKCVLCRVTILLDILDVPRFSSNLCASHNIFESIRILSRYIY